MKRTHKIETTSFSLHVLATMCMLCDHLWGTVVQGNDWLTCIGRISFPIFAFLIVEGYFHTGNLKRYVKRLTLFAVVSEIPFNLAMGSRFFYPVHQNVLWTFLLAIAMILINEKARTSGRIWLRILTATATIILGSIIGLITMVDYYHAGILTVLVFYFFRGRKWWNYIGQLVCLAYINLEMLGGLSYEFQIMGQTHFFAQQGFALLSLIPIWMYRGQRGFHHKAVQYAFYAFYPLHLLILGTIMML